MLELTALIAVVGIAGVAMTLQFLQQKRQERHLTGVLDRFLSRHFQEYSLSEALRQEPEVAQAPEDALDQMDHDAVNAAVAAAERVVREMSGRPA